MFTKGQKVRVDGRYNGVILEVHGFYALVSVFAQSNRMVSFSLLQAR